MFCCLSMTLKQTLPDIAAPGVNVLAATNPSNPTGYNGYAFDSGTSMSCPHVAGIVALLKSLHPNWSSAAIRSTLTTTASTTDPIEDAQKIAGPSDFEGSIVNPNQAADPGLIYDMGMTDYVQYLCSIGYSNSAISTLTLHPSICPQKNPSVLNLNLPSISIPNLIALVTVTRLLLMLVPLTTHASVRLSARLGYKSQ